MTQLVKTSLGPLPAPRHVTSSRLARWSTWVLAAGHHRRHYLAPLGGAGFWGTWIYTETALTNPTWCEPTIYAGVSAVLGIGTAVAVRSGVRHYPAIYASTATTGALAWSAWQVADPTLQGAAIGGIGTIAASLPYWYWLAHHRLAQAKLAKKAGTGSTPELAAGPLADGDVAGALALIGVAGATRDYINTNPDGGWTALISLPVGSSARDIRTPQRQARLSAALRLPPGWSLEIHDGGTEHHLIVTAHPPLPELEAVPLPTHHPVLDELAEWDPWAPLPAGIDIVTGDTVYLHLLGRAGILIAGLQRMGKSVLLSAIVAHLALSKAKLILADAKLVELAMWAPLADVFVGRDPEAFLATLLDLQQEIDERYGRLVAEGRTKAEPGDGWQPIALIVDELAAFLDIPDRKLRSKILSVLRDVVSRGPACLIPVVVATQKPEDKVVPSQIRDVCGQRVSLATTTPEMTDTILGRGWAKRGAAAHLIGEDEKGAAFILEDGSRPRRVQLFPFEPPERRQVIAFAHELWPERRGADVPLPGAGATQELDPTPPEGGRRLRSVPCFPDGTRIPDNRVPLWGALDKFGSGGATINDLVALGLPGYNARTSVDGPLQQWRRLGWVVDIGRDGRAQLFALIHHAEAA